MMAAPEKRNAPCPARSEGAEHSTDLRTHATAPRLPRAGTARAAVLAALQRGRSLTSCDALRDFGTSRLAADVHELRRMGWPVLAETVEVATRHGSSYVARYSLPVEVAP